MTRTIRILKDIGPDGLIKRGDLFHLAGDGFYRSQRIPSQTFSTEYIGLHLNGRKLEVIANSGAIINRYPYG
jgi:hypothetical protein